ncbi:MAG TPA: aldo/keto reductase [Pyrinomonadaceae bacterium]|nr:aldo/keto reductase [Pyrinomonadaceae bacterium]
MESLTDTDPHPFVRCDPAAFGKPITRLGLAARGRTGLSRDDVLHAIRRGVRFLNWPGLAEGGAAPDAFSEAIRSLGSLRDEVVVCAQFGARTASEARGELKALLRALGTDYVDVLTLYYVEESEEWDRLCGSGGALEFCRAAKRDGVVRRIGVTSHRRRLAAGMAQSGELDALMIRYNAAHRGAEREVFPVTKRLGIPVICYTATRWGALLRATPDDPPGYKVPRAPAWYRFVLQEPAASVVLCAPGDPTELEEDLTVLSATGPLPPDEHARLAEHGSRVKSNAGQFE